MCLCTVQNAALTYIGYLDVAIMKKIHETCKKNLKFVSETRGNRSREYLVSESWGVFCTFGLSFKTFLEEL